MVIFCVGFRPNTKLGNGQLKQFHNNGAYLTDLMQQTSRPDVYAVGDCATVYNNAIEDTDYIALATNAVRSGIIAAQCLRHRAEISGSTGFQWNQHLGLKHGEHRAFPGARKKAGF